MGPGAVDAAPPAPAAASAVAATRTVSVEIRGGKGHQHKINGIAWRQGMTVLSALQQVGKRKQKPIKHVATGSGETAFVKEIDGLPNEGSGGRNWMYEVNGKGSGVSCGSRQLKPGDRVLWSFERYN